MASVTMKVIVADLPEVKAYIEKLQVCGTCAHCRDQYYDVNELDCELVDVSTLVGDATCVVEHRDPCRFNPSRWTPYWAEQ